MRNSVLRHSVRHRAAAAAAALALAGSWSLALAAPASADEIRIHDWARSYLNLSAANAISTGSGVTVALLDSGVVGSRADLTGQVVGSVDFEGGTEQSGQTGWGEHGTCMASIIAGHGRSGNNGMLGVAPNAKLLSVRVIRDEDAPDVGTGSTVTTTPLSTGIRYAVDHGAQVISMSLGGQETDAAGDATAEADAIRYALAHNVVVVAAAGNTGRTGNTIQYPGGIRGVITVAAVNSAGSHASFSTTGWDVAVAAPGVSIPCDAADTDASYMLGDGTSQATAYVAGVAALLKSANSKLSPAQIASILESTTSSKPSGGRDDSIGYGIVNPVAALKLAQSTTAATETVSAGKGTATGYFGYGPTLLVSEAAPTFGALPRALAGGALLLAAAGAYGYLMVRRARRAAARAIMTEGPPNGPDTLAE